MTIIYTSPGFLYNRGIAAGKSIQLIADNRWQGYFRVTLGDVDQALSYLKILVR